MDISSAWLALIGVLIGSVATFAGTYVTARFQSRDSDTARRDADRRDRLACHTELTIALYQFAEIARRMTVDLGTLVTDDDRAQYTIAWNATQVRQAAAVIAGPNELTTAARTVDDAVFDFKRATSRLISEQRQTDRWDEAWIKFWDAVNLYVDTVRTEFHPDTK
ncbi:hypothetical protein [Williamsia sterculiae]|uniref:hypothetical protein n=1 Tax=Williamsia sterculiae TaxID=1344003 RepID=UPI0011807FCD|nr:hypothetical protein [Williamsia sterculiae]